MKKKSLVYFGGLLTYLIITSHGPTPTPPWEKENVSFPMMNQEIRNSMQENDRQTDRKNKQLQNSTLEIANQKQWQKFKEVKAKIQDRLRLVDFAMQSIPTGYQIFMDSKTIADIQSQILAEIQTAPYAIAIALPAELQFVNDMQMVVRLLTGIVVSYGAINQMEKAERKLLLDFALGEVTNLKTSSSIILFKIRDAKQKFEFNKLRITDYVNNDKEIVKAIMNHF